MAENITDEARALISKLSYCPGLDGDITLECIGDVLIIRGSVPSFYLKQVLQRDLLRIKGIETIDNRLQVSYCSDAGIDEDETGKG